MKKIVLPIGLTLAADGGEDPNVVEKLRSAGDGMITSIASLEDYLEEPLKAKFLAVKKQINTMLAALPPTDQAPAAMRSNDILGQLLSVLSFAQSMISDLTSSSRSSGEALAATRASIGPEIDKAIKAKRDAKELFDKAEVDVLVAEAVKKAVESARGCWDVEIKQISGRRAALATAGLPIPDDDKLKGDDAAFTAAQAKAKERLDKIGALKVKVAPGSLLTLAWNQDDQAFETALSLLNDAAASVKTGKANGFVSASTVEPAELRTRVGAI